LLSLIPTLLLLLVFGWSLAILFGLATVRFRDLKHISEVGFQGMFYLTPIMIPEQMAHDLNGTPHRRLALPAQSACPLPRFVARPRRVGTSAGAGSIHGRVSHYAIHYVCRDSGVEIARAQGDLLPIIGLAAVIRPLREDA